MTPQNAPVDSRQIWTFRSLAAVVRPGLNALISHTWRGAERLPRDTGFIVVPNHVTEIDPLIVGHFLYNQGVLPHFLAKESLFRVPGLAALLRWTGQVPVSRGATTAGGSLEVSRRVIDEGGGIIVYPEGTLTRDPDLWPMRGRTGAARLALRTGAPVVPVVHWGAQDLFPRYAKRLHPFPRKHVTVVVGDPVDLSEFAGQPLTRTVLAAATEKIMAAITDELARLRGEEPPAVRWDPDQHGQPATGRHFDAGTDGAGATEAGTEAAGDRADDR
ncbi:1-acyl-sn-glycerol-3-phosphate acyltransferase [Tersicoccus solisilvae]|uniref:1-acyl-sn-glycerol-3-phosphate acyltransferase n=1 Tax=Tersicoccus solisilvae TaxID=1882339 RepID=A0ABQ1PD34_9MICC|nr:lysophospholipid acyltransferase family protein [Tersicoccus solisilvae]GGC94842.1 1-acyl-sn-glycerol-3-phosphate acyltransferase [Tersicoccus solisilvae]